MTPSELRRQCREGLYTSSTSGCCPGYAQANLVILPAKVAADFEHLCRENPVPIPLIGKTEVGNPHRLTDQNVIHDTEFDLTRDFPKYLVYENGKLLATPTNISSIWRDDHVGFLIGCSYSFDTALTRAGLGPRNLAVNKNVSMYITNRRLRETGVFVNVPYVVSMRPYREADVSRVIEITSPFTKTHGAPIAYGYDAAERLGIADLKTPDFGDPTVIHRDEVPVFWGCGVTAQLAALSIHDIIEGPIIGHAPGHLLVTDLRDEDVMET